MHVTRSKAYIVSFGLDSVVLTGIKKTFLKVSRVIPGSHIDARK